MLSNKTTLLTFSLIFFVGITFAQRGKDGTVTVANPNTIVNTYTALTANVNSGATTISVSSNALNTGTVNYSFAGALAQGDLVMIIQMQGASINADHSWGGDNTYPTEWVNGSLAFWVQPWLWGTVTNYNSAGKYEVMEVLSVSGTTTINFTCPLQNSYTVAGKTQIVRIPRFQDLTLSANASVVPTNWLGQTGGVVSVEVNGNLTLNTGAKISATGRGFRGATTQLGSLVQTCATHTNGAGNGNSQLGSINALEGAKKGEGIAGYETEYIALFATYGRGAPANGGGGGGYQNSGGGGGSNVANGSYTGKGIPSIAFANSIWNLESAGLGGSASAGGGRGGYSLSVSDQNELTVGPNNALWCAAGAGSAGDARKENGGFGGHNLIYDATRVFMGGGGGAGDGNNTSQPGAGGNGGGIVFVTCYGTIGGSGSVEADGNVGQNSNPLNQGVSSFPSTSNKKGNDGAGGAGGGGSIIIKNANPIGGTVSLNARGGAGGNQVLTIGSGAAWEASGPGGGGGGGFVSVANGTPLTSVSGGAAGTTNSTHVTAFNVNGATGGAPGLIQSTTFFDIIPTNATICTGATANLSVTTVGVVPGTITWYTQQFGGTSVGTGTNFTTPALSVTTTYYVGVCPGTFRVPVTVTVTSGTASTFAQLGPYCIGTAFTLPTLSTNGITGTWSPAINSSMTTTYTFTPNAGQCGLPATMTVTISSSSTPTFTQISAICTGTSFSLPTSSLEGINGNWSPAINNSSTTTYTFTPNSGQCATTTTMTVTVNQPVSPTFTQVAPICSGTTFSLPSSSLQGINGSWSPAINNTSTTSYTFTPSAGQCANAATMTVTINPPVAPTFIQVAPVCVGSAFTLPSSSLEGITGTWSPAINSASTTTYTFSPTVGQCATTATMTVNVGPPVSPTFTQVSTLCSGTVFSLPVSSLEGINGTWSPAINTSTTTTYTFIPSAGQCATTATMTVTIGSPVTPTFNQLTPVCVGSTFTLPSASLEGINGTWSPVINTAATTTYTFTPSPGQCANNGAMTVVVTSPVVPTFPTYGPFCLNDVLVQVMLPGTSNNGIVGSWNPGMLSSSISGVTTYTFTPSAGQCATPYSSNVVVNPLPVINLSNSVVTNENCSQGDGSISGLIVSGTSGNYTYSWNNSPQLTTLDLTDLSSGTYVLEVTDGNGCIAQATVDVLGTQPPVIDQTGLIVQQPTCNTGGEISGLVVSGNQPFTYVWANTNQTTANLVNASPGSYSLTVTDAGGCTSTFGPIVLNQPTVPVASFTWSPQNPEENTSVTFSDNSSGNIVSYSWSINGQTFTGQQIEYTVQEGEYIIELTVTDANGCTDDYTIILPVFDEITIPNVLTLNNDGVNDLFVIEGLIPNSTLLILNRWGEVVFSSTNYKNDWNGKDNNGIPLTEGVYTYLLLDAEGKELHGFVHLLK